MTRYQELYGDIVPDEATGRRLISRLIRICNRCFNPASDAYYYYGARGIRVAVELLDRRAWLRYMSSLPGFDDPSLSIDRIDNNRGYEPGNLRFTTSAVQMANRRGAPEDVFAGQKINGYEVVDGRRSNRRDNTLQVMCKCLKCGTLQWKDRAKLVKGTCTKCIVCFNKAQSDAAKARRSQV